jgi:tRNA pseudouridine38-40 synthase
MPIYATQFSAEDIAAEERRPKKKVAVMIGYSGTGYHGMQLFVHSWQIHWNELLTFSM